MNAYTRANLEDSVAIEPIRLRIESPIGGTVAIVGDTAEVAPEAVDADPVPKAVPVPHVVRSAMLPRACLTAAVASAIRAIEKRNTIPILSNVRITGNGDGVTVRGTDLDLTIDSICAGTVDAGFDVTIPGHSLHDVLKKAKAAEFVIVTDGERKRRDAPSITLDFDGLKVTMDGLPVTDYPAPGWPEKGDTHGFTMPAADLFALLDRTMIAISTEETRYYLNGIFLHVLNVYGRQYLSAVACDGHRLAKHNVDLPDGAVVPPVSLDGKNGVLIPRKAVGELHRVLKAKGCPETVACRLHVDKLEFAIGSTVITTKTIDGTFPAYDRVIPTGNEKFATINRKAISEAVAAVAVMQSERGRSCQFAFEPGKVTLTVANPDMGRAEMSVPVDYAAEPVTIGFNSKYFTDILGNMDGDEVRIALGDAGSPALFTDPEADGSLMVLMPMRV